MNKSKLVNGNIFKTLVTFSLPLVIINPVQLLFHSTDIAVLGIMATDADVAAVGACGSIISILLCVFAGYSSAANVIVAKRVGAGDVEGARRATGCALVVGFLSGVILMTVTLIFAERFLILTNCQPDVLEMATLYMRIYFIGMPVTMLYNFTAAVLRATGDSVRPMIYMIISGVFNVVLNLVFVGALNMAVAGVALATVLSNAIAMIAALAALIKNKDYCKIKLKNLRLFKSEFLEIIKIGVPSCLGGVFFYAGEVVIISAVNSVSTNAMTANAIASQLDRAQYSIGSSIASAAGVMVSQNYGAKNVEKIPKIMSTGALYLSFVTLIMGATIMLFSNPILGLFTDSDAVIALANERLYVTLLTNFITCSMEVFSSSLRAMKRSRSILVVGFICGFLIRSIWPLLIWNVSLPLYWLFAALPVSTLVANVIYAFVYRGAIRAARAEVQTKKNAPLAV